MQQQPSVKKNYFFKLLYELLCIICPFITSPYVARVLGPDGVGIASYTSSIMAYFATVCALGTFSYGTREIAQARDNKYYTSRLFWEIELISVFSSCICILGWILLILLSKEYKYYFLALSPQLIATMINISWFFTGQEKMGYVILRDAFCKILGIILLFLLVKEKEDLAIYLILNTSIVLLGNLSMWLHLPQMLIKVNPQEFHFKKHFLQTLVYFVPSIATSLFSILDKFLIGFITKNPFQSGYYEQAGKIIEISKALSFTALNSAMSARISYLFSKNNMADINAKISKSMDYILLIAFGCLFGIIGIAKNFVPFFFGSGYEPVIKILVLMTPLTVILGISNCLDSQYYIPSGNRSKSTKYILYGVGANLLISISLIPKLGAEGATIGSVTAETFVLVLFLKNCDGFFKVSDIIRFSWKRIISGSIMCIAVYLIGSILNCSEIIVVLLQLLTGVVLYGCLLLLFKDEMVIYLKKKLFDIVSEKLKIE